MKYFRLSEFSESETARRLGIVNDIPKEARKNIIDLVDKILDPAREMLESPIVVTSGYRCPRLNRAVGGAPESLHLQGRAADVRCRDMPMLLKILKQMPYYQLIVYRGKERGEIRWIHVSYRAGNLPSIAYSKYV